MSNELLAARSKILELEDNLRFELERNIALKRELNDTIDHYSAQPTIIAVANGTKDVKSDLERIHTITESLNAKIDDDGKINVQELEQITGSIRSIMDGLDTDARHHILALPHVQREQLQSKVNSILETLRSSLVAR